MYRKTRKKHEKNEDTNYVKMLELKFFFKKNFFTYKNFIKKECGKKVNFAFKMSVAKLN